MYTVLLVEDEDIIRKGIRHSVPWEELNCSVIGEAINGEDGLAKIDELKPDIVITDINMPIMSGLKMLEKARENEDFVSIILTGYSEFAYAKEAIRNGVSDYVLKPLNMQEMLEALKRATLECDNVRFLRKRSEAVESLSALSLLQDEEKKSDEDPIVAGVLTMIKDSFSQKLTMADFEERLHYSERHIGQRFQKVMGTTVIEYLNRYRIQQSISLIREGEVPISELGNICGVGDYKYFNHVFKKYVGCSPKEYRKKITE